MLNKKMQKLGEERSVIREIFEYGNARAKQIGRENVFDFSLGNPSVPAPDGVRTEIERLLRELPSEKLHGYTSAAGAPEVREAVAEYVTKTFGVPMRSDLVYMTCGAAASLAVTLNALAEEGDEFVVLTPCFPEYQVFIEQAGGKPVPVRTDENFHIDLSALASAIGERTKAVLVNSPNNPTGAVYGEEELTALARLLKEKSAQYNKSIFIIADEPYRELTYGAKVPYIPALYSETIVCYSFSKSLSLAGERIGYIAVSPACAGSEEIFSAVCGAGRSLGYVCAPALFQRVCAKLLAVGRYSRLRAQPRSAVQRPNKSGLHLFQTARSVLFVYEKPVAVRDRVLRNGEEARAFTCPVGQLRNRGLRAHFHLRGLWHDRAFPSRLFRSGERVRVVTVPCRHKRYGKQKQRAETSARCFYESIRCKRYFSTDCNTSRNAPSGS